jgi:hypothetical protein
MSLGVTLVEAAFMTSSNYDTTNAKLRQFPRNKSHKIGTRIYPQGFPLLCKLVYRRGVASIIEMDQFPKLLMRFLKRHFRDHIKDEDQWIFANIKQKGKRVMKPFWYKKGDMDRL